MSRVNDSNSSVNCSYYIQKEDACNSKLYSNKFEVQSNFEALWAHSYLLLRMT